MRVKRLSLVEVKQKDVELIPESIMQGWDEVCEFCISERQN